MKLMLAFERLCSRRREFQLSLILLLSSACQTVSWTDGIEAPSRLEGQGIAKYHEYSGVDKCKTAFGLDPRAFEMRVTAASARIVERLPGIHKAGVRGGPYDGRARCIRVEHANGQKTVVVRAIDICCGGDLSSPKTHQLDLSRQAFEQLAPTELGRIPVKWAIIDCPESLQVEKDSDLCDRDYYFKKPG